MSNCAEEPCFSCSIGENFEERPVKQIEGVDHPKHYNLHPSGIECIEIVRHMDFLLGSAMKYLWRAGLKAEEATVKDLKKAIWYIEDKIKMIEGENK
jgi:hypothetical protein